MSTQISVNLMWKTDRNGKDYLIGDLKLPATLELHEGFTLIAWPNKHSPMLVIKPKEDRREKPGDLDQNQNQDLETKADENIEDINSVSDSALS